MRRLIEIGLLTSALLAGLPALAQVGGIVVAVADADGAPLPGATVTLSHETSFVKTTSERTDPRGLVEFPVLRPGSGYAIECSSPGFNKVRFDDIRVKLNEMQTLNVRMFEAFEERVEVVADRGVIDLDESQTSTKFSDSFIADMPVLDRLYQNVLTLAPGVQDADGDGNPNVHGSRSRDFQAVVSGVSNVDPLTGQWMSRINPNSIEEIEVITAGAGVEFGRAQGGFARIIQKQGSNNHEGIVEFYWQTSRLDGSGAKDTSALPDPKFETIQPGFQFSGPIVKDRLWYRASHEVRERDEPVNILSAVELFTNDSETTDAQLTWQVSPRNKLALQFNRDPIDLRNFGVSSRVPAESSQQVDRSVGTWKLHWTAPYSPKVLVETTTAWQDVNIRSAPMLRGRFNDCLPKAQETFLSQGLCLDLANDAISGTYDQTVSDHRQRFTFKSKATIYAGRFLGANHQFKVGVDIENERYFRDLTRTSSLTFEKVFPFGGIPFGIVLARVAVPKADDVRATGTYAGFFVEDQIKPIPGLTVTLGARVDREELNSEGREALDFPSELAGWEQHIAPGEDLLFGDFGLFFTGYEGFNDYKSRMSDILCEGVKADAITNCKINVLEAFGDDNNAELRKRRVIGINIRNTNVSPYLSVAWSPGNDGKTAIKAAAGRHYNNIPLVIPLQELEPVLADIEYRSDLVTGQAKIFDVFSPRLNLSVVDHGLRTPYQDELAVSFERELWPETSIELSYIRRRFEDQIQDVNVNAATGDYGRCESFQIDTQFEVIVDPPVVPSPGSGFPVIDEYTGEVYEDEDPGIGDGREDDCVGTKKFIGLANLRQERPDGFLDLYVQNPFWGGVFRIGNFNRIDYEAYVLELVRRQYRSWEMSASYTWSEATGDGEDFFQELGNDPSLRDSVRGFQSYDQRHVVKLNATSITPWGIRLGTAISWQSGLPYSILLERTSFDAIPPAIQDFKDNGLALRQLYFTGRRNDQRNTPYWNVDLKATREWTLGRGLNLQLSAEIFNVLDDDTYQIYNPFTEAGVQINGTNEAIRRFGRSWQTGLKLAF